MAYTIRVLGGFRAVLLASFLVYLDTLFAPQSLTAHAINRYRSCCDDRGNIDRSKQNEQTSKIE